MLWAATLLLLLMSQATAGAESDRPPSHGCSVDGTWDNAMNMCMPSASSDTGRALVSGRFSAFGVFSMLQGPRGTRQFAAPNMFMLDVGRAFGSRQFLNLDVMATAELWTFPRRGYPELLQIGEERSDGRPYIDAQHPHSSPIMGLTLSDTVKLGSSTSLKLSFAPRGESADGPIAYMHRESARDFPDAPLGHHVGQDVGHISSTVLGAQLATGRVILEASAFNGDEPEPTKLTLPLGTLNSAALRVTYFIQADHRAMASVAHVDQRDAAYPGTTSATRLSASLYDRFALGGHLLDHTFVFGRISRRPNSIAANSFLDEAIWQRGSSDLWGRIEVLQRLASELAIPKSSAGSIADRRWVSALTLGVTSWKGLNHELQFGFGACLTMDFIPNAWATYYGGRTPLTTRFIVQLRGGDRRPRV